MQCGSIELTNNYMDHIDEILDPYSYVHRGRKLRHEQMYHNTQSRVETMREICPRPILGVKFAL